MTSVTRIDQAVLLLRDRLKRLNERSAVSSSASARQARSSRVDPLVPLRQLVQQGRIGQEELRKALVRTLLANALGEELADSLEFQSISDQVLRIIEENGACRDLLAKALGELE